MTSTYTGKCDCGQVEWTAEANQEHILCHCNTCKRLSGGTYTLNQIIPKDALKITKNENKEGQLGKYTYDGLSGNPVHCYFCNNCTTHVYHHQVALGDKLILRTGLLNGGEKFTPTTEIFTKFNFKWEPETGKSFLEMPS